MVPSSTTWIDPVISMASKQLNQNGRALFKVVSFAAILGRQGLFEELIFGDEKLTGFLARGKMGAHLSQLNLAPKCWIIIPLAMLVYQEFKQILIQISSFPKTNTIM